MTDLKVTYRGVIVPDRYHNNLDRAEFANFKLGVDAVLYGSHKLRVAKHIHQDMKLLGSDFRYEQSDGTWWTGDADPITYYADEAEHYLSTGVWEILITKQGESLCISMLESIGSAMANLKRKTSTPLKTHFSLS